MTEQTEKMLAHAVETMKGGDGDNAYRTIVSVVSNEPNNLGAWYHLGQMLHQSGAWDAAVVAFCHALYLGGERVDTLTNLGWNLYLAGRIEESADTLKEAIAIDPSYPLAHTNYSQALHTLGYLDKSVAEAQRAVDLGADDPMAYLGLAFSHFFAGNWSEGFKNFEARIRFRLKEMLNQPYMRWKGDYVDTLFIRAEQGLGDTVMFSRFIPEAASRVGKVVFLAQKEMLSVLAGAMPPNVEVHPFPSPLPPADAWVPLMSLPYVLGRTTPAADGSYMKHSLPGKRLTDQSRIGFIWAGSPGHQSDGDRSMSLTDFLPIIGMVNVGAYSLQIGPRQADIAENWMLGIVDDLSGYVTDVVSFDNALENLDLLISVDTAGAHIAGTSDFPCWVLTNRKKKDWRWGYGEGMSKWYDTVRIFERGLDETWGDVVQRVKRELP